MHKLNTSTLLPIVTAWAEFCAALAGDGGTQTWTQALCGWSLHGDTFPPCSTCDSLHKLGQLKLEAGKQSGGKEEERWKKKTQKKARCKEYLLKLVSLAVTVFILQLSTLVLVWLFIHHCANEVMSN